MTNQDPCQSLGHHATLNTTADAQVVDDLAAAFDRSPLPTAQRLAAFARHVRRQEIARFLAKYELFKLALNTHGSVIECGVFTGGGLMAWAHFSAILEPYNHTRRVIGFDTFAGFPQPHAKDTQHGASEHLHAGAFPTGDAVRSEIEQLAALHDQNRPLGHIPKVELVAGNAIETIPAYLASHPHLLVSLIYLDFDLYEPTRAALEHLLPRVVSGGVVAFDELNCPQFPGETAAFIETTGLQNIHLRRFPFEPHISYYLKP